MQKYETIFRQSEKIDTKEAYEERDRIYKSMDFGEILNIINEIHEISELIAMDTSGFSLDTVELSVISKELKSLEKIAECISTISELRRFRGI